MTVDETLERFFRLKSWKDLDELVASLNPEEPFQAALQFYARTWTAENPDRQAFAPTDYLSADVSAIFYGKCPVIFEGSNQWARKCYLPRSAIEEKLNGLYNRCVKLRAENTTAKICLILIPEKDFIISKVFLGENRFAELIEAVKVLGVKLRALDIPLIFDGPVKRMNEYQTLQNFEYPDSHLPPRHYVMFFSQALRALGFDWQQVSPRVTMKKLPVYFDLSTKFSNPESRAFESYEIEFKGEEIKQIGGSKSFEDPLGDTKQSFENANPVFDQEVLILGDSHSSILNQRRLTYLFAGAFREVQFDWNPAGLRTKSNLSSYGNIVLEVSSRFVV